MSTPSGALRRRKKQKKEGTNPANLASAEPSKQEKEVATYLRFNMKTKEGVCLENQVQYFAGCKAVDMLMASKWASATKKDDSVLFSNRKACVDYCQNLLEKDMFRRVVRIHSHKKSKTSGGDDGVEKKEKKSKKKRKEEETTPTAAENASTGEEKEKEKEKPAEETTKEDAKSKDSTKKKLKKPAKLEPHEEQFFIDGTEKEDALFCWIFDPTPLKTYILGFLVIIGAIAACLYPLWPMQLRVGIYYVCLGLIGLLGLLIALAVVRFFLFAGVWAGTLGKKHLWLFPNLFEDVGFFDSFKPVYTMSTPSDKKKKKTKGEGNKDVKSEEEKTEQKEEKTVELPADRETTDEKVGESAGEQSTGSAAAQDFELVQHSDLDHVSGGEKQDDDDDQLQLSNSEEELEQ